MKTSIAIEKSGKILILKLWAKMLLANQTGGFFKM